MHTGRQAGPRRLLGDRLSVRRSSCKLTKWWTHGHSHLGASLHLGSTHVLAIHFAAMCVCMTNVTKDTGMADPRRACSAWRHGVMADDHA